MTQAASSEARPPAFAALRHRGFRAYFLTSALAMMADSIEHVISYWIIFQKFHSPTLGGIAVLTHWLPTLLWCICIAGFAAADSYPVAVALLFLAGFFNLALSAMAQTLVQLHAPEQIRGRVIGLYGMSALGLRAFSGITVGVMGSVVGIHWSLAASAAALLAAVAILLAFSMRPRPG